MAVPFSGSMDSFETFVREKGFQLMLKKLLIKWDTGV